MRGITRPGLVFDRWQPRQPTSWPLQVFRAHERELTGIYIAYEAASRYTYKTLGGTATKADSPSKHFQFISLIRSRDHFDDMEMWSNGFNAFANWTRLNTLVTVASYLETYLASMVSLALESDIGVLYGSSRSVDGTHVLKYGNISKANHVDLVERCVRGSWHVRCHAYAKIFGSVPKVVSDNVKSLEAMRVFRNRSAHAFGRDIANSRRRGIRRNEPIGRISEKRLAKFISLAGEVATAVDKHLLYDHVGAFEDILFYHKLFPALNASAHFGTRGMALKRELGSFGTPPVPKSFCWGLVTYYESI